MPGPRGRVERGGPSGVDWLPEYKVLANSNHRGPYVPKNRGQSNWTESQSRERLSKEPPLPAEPKPAGFSD